MAKQKKHKLENLIALSYKKDEKNGSPIVSLIEAERLLNSPIYKGEILINSEKGTWSYSNQEKIPIGGSVISLENYNKNTNGIIGIYDRTSTPHLISMMRTAQWTRPKKLYKD